jgi:hypothetical protein
VKRSVFAPTGLWHHANQAPLAKRLFETAQALFGVHGEHFSDEAGSTVDEVSFVAARMIARAVEKVRRAGAQRYANGVYDLLREQEEEHEIVADPRSTPAARRRVIAARKRLPRGSARAPLEDALETLLGDNYVGLRITRPDAPWNELSLFPAALGDQPQNLQIAEVDRKLVRITPPVCIALGEPQWVRYTAVDPLFPVADVPAHTLVAHDHLVVEPEILGRTEVVEVLDTDLENPEEAPIQRFLAVFNQAHESNCYATTSPFPLWISNQRAIVVVLKPGAILDLEVRRQVHDHLRRSLSAVTTWALVQESDPEHAGPFTLDDPALGMLDANPLEPLAVKYLPP